MDQIKWAGLELEFVRDSCCHTSSFILALACSWSHFNQSGDFPGNSSCPSFTISFSTIVIKQREIETKVKEWLWGIGFDNLKFRSITYRRVEGWLKQGNSLGDRNLTWQPNNPLEMNGSSLLSSNMEQIQASKIPWIIQTSWFEVTLLNPP